MLHQYFSPNHSSVTRWSLRPPSSVPPGTIIRRPWRIYGKPSIFLWNDYRGTGQVTINAIPANAIASGYNFELKQIITAIPSPAIATGALAEIRNSGDGISLGASGSYDYISTLYLVSLCDICGFKRKKKELIERWDGLMVCDPTIKEGCWEQRHPQEFIRPIPDQVAPTFSRPEPTDTFLEEACTISGMQGLADYATADCAMVEVDYGYRDPPPFI